jgi:hypothetical protein
MRVADANYVFDLFEDRWLRCEGRNANAPKERRYVDPCGYPGEEEQ